MATIQLIGEYGSGAGNIHNKFNLEGEDTDMIDTGSLDEPEQNTNDKSDRTLKRSKFNSAEDKYTVEIWPSRIWKQPYQKTSIPDLCYCELCGELFFSRKKIFHHFVSPEHAAAASMKRREGKTTPPKSTPELKKGLNLKEFLSCLLPLTLEEKDPKCFSLDLYKVIRKSTLVGAPSDRTFGDFLLWLLTQTWCADDKFEREFLDKLFDLRKVDVDWDWFWQWQPLSRLDYDYIPPTICIYYDDNSLASLLVNLNDVSHPSIEEKGEDYTMDITRENTFLYRNCKFFDDRIYDREIEDYVDQPTMKCWDPEDKSNMRHFEGKEDKLYPYHNKAYGLRGVPFSDGYPVFELFSISIDEVGPGREFHLIYISSNITNGIPMILYKRPPGEFDPKMKGKPLLLKGPFRTPSPLEDDVLISFTNKNNLKESWWFGLLNFMSNPMKEAIGRVITHKCYSEDKKSRATIVYRAVQDAARAELTLTFVEKKGQAVYVKHGAITATDGNDPRTRRIIRQYSVEEAPVCLRSGQVLKVYRSEFGVPLTEYLRVNVKLAYCVEGFPDEEKMIEGSLVFPRPKHYSSQGQRLRASDSRNTFLCVETFWTTPRAVS